MSDMDAAAFLADVEMKPRVLRALADALDDGAVRWQLAAMPARVLLTGMGSSFFAAQSAALRLRRAGVAAVAELASVEASWPSSPDLLVVGISASGGSEETLGFVAGHPGFTALTNVDGSKITAGAAHVVPMLAEPEASGVACRSFQHTLVALLALEEQLTGIDLSLSEKVRRCADATEMLLSERSWLDDVTAALDGPHGVYAIAPSERISSALQGALMVREVPRRPADGCETGDWSHVDVYLTKTLQYRALLFPGSPHDAAARSWLAQRGATTVMVGEGVPIGSNDTHSDHTRSDHTHRDHTDSDRTVQVRYPGDDDRLVALLTEVLVPELLAARWWLTAH